MVNKLSFWLESIVEDDPLPDEINIIVFKVTENGKYKFIELLGLENELNLNKAHFRPLEAQFFNIKEIWTNNESLLIYRLKRYIDDAFDTKILKKQYLNRKIYLFFRKFDYLFTIQ